MVLTKSELIASLQKEVRILLHLVTKIDTAVLYYRPTPQQRSTIELLTYLTNMGPTLVRYAKGHTLDAAAMSAAIEKANLRSFDETVTALAAHSDLYVQLLADMSDDDFRAEITGIDGRPTTRRHFMVNHVIGQCAAYRMQLFLYLKACGRRRPEYDEPLGGDGRSHARVGRAEVRSGEESRRECCSYSPFLCSGGFKCRQPRRSPRQCLSPTPCSRISGCRSQPKAIRRLRGSRQRSGCCPLQCWCPRFSSSTLGAPSTTQSLSSS